MSSTEAQEEFQRFVDKNNEGPAEDRNLHPEDRFDRQREASATATDPDYLNEEEQYRSRQIDDAMRIPGNNGFNVQLPPASFDSGRATGVKGVIADARSYETARQSSRVNRTRNVRRSIFGGELGFTSNGNEKSDSEEDPLQEEEEETFLAQWRESRRRELEDESRSGSAVRTRRTSPSVRIYGRLDAVDALGYLDAIEKVGHETVVVVFVYDNECQVSSAVESALRPIVSANPTVRFVKVQYDDIEFDNAAVPSILAYRNQGDLIANLTGLIELLPGEDDDAFSSDALRKLLQSQGVL
ncbi:putative phosducin [Grosmannia clavigera kw1407]|uniref:Putative phosducin n=1 Tax=Grosmannia clavigera (strain kw1407 / UAMH 11150) TaxID=655863 RepID=F0XPW8_GROCL|nr:putative phosducin [Grosmannia clavigera kw1407]EFX00146.1 putative phosducin [Grosmannia clavigera kw1407]